MKLKQILKISAILVFIAITTLSSCNFGGKDQANTGNVGTDSLAAQVNESEGEVNSSNTAENLVDSKDESKLNNSQKRIQFLLKSCVNKDYDAAASVIMYRGADQSRVGQDSFSNANPQEANTVKVTCDVILGWLGSSQSYEFISYQEEETEFGLQYVVEVMFTQEKLGFKRHFFYLMDTPKGQMLVNMI